MPASTKNEKRPEKAQTREPAKGGITPAHRIHIPPATTPSLTATRCGM